VNTRRITLLVAVVLALGTGILTLRYLTSIQQQANDQQANVEMKPIVVAAKDIPARVKITPEMLIRVQRPATQIEPGALDVPSQANGDIALISIPAGSTVTQSKIGQPSEVGLTERLKPGMRALSIPVDRVKAISGLLEPGDRVDVLASPARAADSQPKAVTIIRGAIVLAINDAIDAVGGASPSPQSANLVTVTLGISAQQADLLTMADLNATLRLALRSPKEPVNSLPPETLVFPENGGSAPAPSGSVPEPFTFANMQPAPVSGGPRYAPQFGPNAGHVTVIDGDKVVSEFR
jgi:pilus assembly protein CpaB